MTRHYRFRIPKRSPPRYVLANRIADALRANAPILALSNWLLVLDIRERFHCGQTTAQRAIGFARRV